MNHAIIGMGEVGSALASILKERFYVYTKDIGDQPAPEQEIDVLHVCLNYHGIGHERFVAIVNNYIELYDPMIVDICSTVSPGTTVLFGPRAVHSTTRGLHPNLKSGLLNIVKHVGGPMAQEMAMEFELAGIKCATHAIATTTELLHILNNSHYGINLMFADEAAKLCREYGVDYFAYMEYTKSHNEGFAAIDHARHARPILMPPGGHIGGHCVMQGSTLIPADKLGPMMTQLAAYNKNK